MCSSTQIQTGQLCRLMCASEEVGGHSADGLCEICWSMIEGMMIYLFRVAVLQ